MSEFLTITEQDNQVFRLTLDRTDVHNAFDDVLIADLTLALGEIAAAKPRVLVLQANGKSFSAGADLNWMKKSAGYSVDENFKDALALAHMLERLANFPCTTIAAVQGAAFGGGVGLVACCDIAIAADSASFSLSEVRLGLIPATISPFVLDAIGQRQARRYFATAERFSAATAEKISLVHEVVEAAELPSAVEKCIHNLLQGSPASQMKARQLIRDIGGRAIDESLLEQAAGSIADVRASDEGREGISAFLEKRKPQWAPVATGHEGSAKNSDGNKH